MLHALTIHEAHEGLKQKKFSSTELTKACLSRIKTVDGKLNAFTYVAEEEAIQMAQKADDFIAKCFASGDSFDPLTGVPVAIKDVFCVDGMAVTACSKLLKDFKPPYDAAVVSKLRQFLAVFLGKTNTDEFTCGASTETSCFGPTKNPWDLARVPGGSSGGSAAAVSADECVYALGTDTGGSIRQPASLCGITGLRVTYGRVSRFGVISMASSLDTIGPLAKDARDIAYIMDIITWRDSYDSTMPDVEAPSYTGSLRDSDLSGFTIGIPKEYFIEGLDHDTERSVRAALEIFKKTGVQIREISLPHTKYATAVYYVICPSEVSANMARYDGIRFGPGLDFDAENLMEYYLNVRGRGFGDEMKRRIMTGTFALSSGYYDAYYLKAQKVRALVKKDFDEAFKKVDVIIAPVSPTPAFKIGEKTSDPIQMYLADIFTTPPAVAGMPGLVIPCGFSSGSSKLPVGLQLIGNQFQEPLLLRFGHAFQQQTDWHKIKPAV